MEIGIRKLIDEILKMYIKADFRVKYCITILSFITWGTETLALSKKLRLSFMVVMDFIAGYYEKKFSYAL